jgi:hypothetical protein
LNWQPVIVASFGVTVAVSVAVVCDVAVPVPVTTVGAGSVPVRASPLESTAAQTPSMTQETPVKATVSGEAELHEGCAAVGLSLSKMSPAESPAMHSVPAVQATAVRPLVPRRVWLHVELAELGSPLATAQPADVTATQLPLGEQAIAFSPVAVLATVHGALVGVALTRMLPLESTAAQKVAALHETPSRSLVESIPVTSVQGPLPGVAL